MDDFAGLFDDNGRAQKFLKTWVDIYCKKGRHYARLCTFKDGKKSRKIAGGRGYIGTITAAVTLGYKSRVIDYTRRHQCHYPDKWAATLERIADITHASGSDNSIFGGISGGGRVGTVQSGADTKPGRVDA